MIAVDMLTILAVFIGVGLVLAGLAVAHDRVVYWLAARSERHQAIRRAARHRHPAGSRAGAR